MYGMIYTIASRIYNARCLMKVRFMNFFSSKKCMQQSDSEEGVKTPLKYIIVWTQSRNAEISNNEKNRILTETNEY